MVKFAIKFAINYGHKTLTKWRNHWWKLNYIHFDLNFNKVIYNQYSLKIEQLKQMTPLKEINYLLFFLEINVSFIYNKWSESYILVVGSVLKIIALSLLVLIIATVCKIMKVVSFESSISCYWLDKIITPQKISLVNLIRTSPEVTHHLKRWKTVNW